MKNTEIKRQLNNIPSSPGAYFFKDAKGKIIYIGKAVNLKVRVKGYFKSSREALGYIKSLMIPEIAKIDFKITENEIDALILESQMIKKYKPKYNVMLKDDKNYFYVVFTGDKFPKVYITHQISKFYFLNSKFYPMGPYTDGTALKATLRYLRKIFPYCTCKNSHNIKCLKAHLGLCFGDCCLKQVNKERMADDKRREYQKNIKSLIAILSGKKKTILARMEKEMKVAGKNEDFEKAAKVRDQIHSLKNIFEHRVFRYSDQINKNKFYTENIKSEFRKLFGKKIERIEFYDISNIQGQLAVGSMIVFDGAKINKDEYRKFKIKTVFSADDSAMIKEVLMRRLSHKEWTMPDLIVVDGGATQLNTAKEALNYYNLSNIKYASLAKNPDRLFLSDNRQIALKSLPEDFKLFLQGLRDEAHRFAISYHKKLRHKKLKEEFKFKQKTIKTAD